MAGKQCCGCGPPNQPKQNEYKKLNLYHRVILESHLHLIISNHGLMTLFLWV